jgi:hypothetical protein
MDDAHFLMLVPAVTTCSTITFTWYCIQPRKWDGVMPAPIHSFHPEEKYNMDGIKHKPYDYVATFYLCYLLNESP